MRTLLILLLLCLSFCGYSQFQSANYLVGYTTGLDSFTTTMRARINFDSGFQGIPEARPMKFVGAQANISDSMGNIVIATNGVYVADATGNIMDNGDDLNPGQYTSDFSDGLPFASANIIVPFPGQQNQFVLFHMTGNYDANLAATEIYYSVIDLNLNGGLGRVISKNLIAVQDTFSYGIAACKHANGRDWWIVAIKDNSDLAYKILLTPDGVSQISTQNLNVPPAYLNATQPLFSPDGSKFAYSLSNAFNGPWVFYVYLFDFDRCSGMFSNAKIIDCTDTHPGSALAFSRSSQFLYAASTYHIFQMRTDSLAQPSLDSVASNDGYYSPYPPLLDNFWYMYLANDDKIYITAGNSVVDLHYINYPDSSGVSCDVRQHAIRLPCYNFRTVPNHPNYGLGAFQSSVCDTITAIRELPQNSVPKLSVYYNSNLQNAFLQAYDLKGNHLKIILTDISGRILFVDDVIADAGNFSKNIPMDNLAAGIYLVTIVTEKENVSEKFVKN
ncbi:MAG: T9SS type A sorting domain-containing protein [Bacteroidetes bacterium]|nr:T9SS type A sorting domain-containing protein [Bacteroidota bacterium]MBK9414785.1 T9SS type A sorting domain-containing protein [Bacteroidota bacterium]